MNLSCDWPDKLFVVAANEILKNKNWLGLSTENFVLFLFNEVATENSTSCCGCWWRCCCWWEIQGFRLIFLIMWTCRVAKNLLPWYLNSSVPFAQRKSPAKPFIPINCSRNSALMKVFCDLFFCFSFPENSMSNMTRLSRVKNAERGIRTQSRKTWIKLAPTVLVFSCRLRYINPVC